MKQVGIGVLAFVGALLLAVLYIEVVAPLSWPKIVIPWLVLGVGAWRSAGRTTPVSIGLTSAFAVFTLAAVYSLSAGF